jgi:putative oxidoreductase
MIVINGFVALIGRILLSALFILAGFGKVGDISSFAGYMTSLGLPASLAWPAAIFEIVFGIFTRLFALLLAGFCIVTALTAHNDFADPMQQANFLKNMALAGGFLILFAYNGVSHSLDSLRARRREAVVHRETVVEREPVVVRETPRV